MGEARRRKAAGRIPTPTQPETELETAERVGRELQMPEEFMRQVRAMLAPDGPDYTALKAAGGDPAIAFQCMALAEAVSTDGYVDPEKWETLMQMAGLRDAQGKRIKRARRR